MPRPKLTALQIKKFVTPPHRRQWLYPDATKHLYVQVTKTTDAKGAVSYGRSWVFVYSRRQPKASATGKSYFPKRYMGLGSVEDVTLETARKLAKDHRAVLLEGRDPIEARTLARKPVVEHTLKAATLAYHTAHRAGWGDRHAQLWLATMEADVFPRIGDQDIGILTPDRVLAVLEPIWQIKPTTANLVRGRIEAVWSYGKARGWASGENPARWKDNLANLLPAPGKLSKTKHQPSLPWPEIPTFMAELRDDRLMASRALEFAILTGARTDETLGARWPEIDLERAVWHVPAYRMKGDEPHKVPLSGAAIALLRALPDHAPTDFVFMNDGHRLGKGAMLECLHRFGRTIIDDDGETKKIVVHGFRTSLRMFGVDHGYQEIVCDMALAHKQTDQVKAAYTRGTLFSQRMSLLAQWADHCAGR
jgi:integrase